MPDMLKTSRPWPQRLGIIALSTVIGAVLWAIPIGLIVLTSRGQSANKGVPAFAFICGVMLIALLFIAMSGWKWFSQYKFGTRGHQLKFLALLGVVMSGVGNIFTLYWTGRFVLVRATRLMDD